MWAIAHSCFPAFIFVIFLYEGFGVSETAFPMSGASSDGFSLFYLLTSGVPYTSLSIHSLPLYFWILVFSPCMLSPPLGFYLCLSWWLSAPVFLTSTARPWIHYWQTKQVPVLLWAWPLEGRWGHPKKHKSNALVLAPKYPQGVMPMSDALLSMFVKGNDRVVCSCLFHKMFNLLTSNKIFVHLMVTDSPWFTDFTLRMIKAAVRGFGRKTSNLTTEKAKTPTTVAPPPPLS